MAEGPSRMCSTCDRRGHSAERYPSVASLLTACSREDDVLEDVVSLLAFVGHVQWGGLFDGVMDWEMSDRLDGQAGDECWVTNSGVSKYMTPNTSRIFDLKSYSASVITATGAMYKLLLIWAVY